MLKDITPILQGWDYDPEGVNVRKIIGKDGREKIQMRVDLGLIQMEMTGRPDGERPYGRESLLDYHLERLARHRERHGTDAGFRLSPRECEELRAEGTQYYFRYFSLYHLGDYAGVERDTNRNIRLFDLLRDYAEEESDRLSLEQYRPYILMMNTRARAHQSLEQGWTRRALQQIEEGIRKIEDFAQSYQREDFNAIAEYHIDGLREWAEHIRETDPLTATERRLRQELQEAVAREDYERAARLRDMIRRMSER
ncbi:MAG: UvrB/UvrC motif-containing protein [Abditibacteriales bacterium]|nr:UvrB/UvrC motif-containing protein [Abditibacteriales bacterium]MDW8364428.1 UvrB/UvrC motif-containing protein [Abditibacteriales bacterium]